MGLATAHGRNYRAFYKRLSKIAVCAFIITIMSLVMFAKSWIYFGILHFSIGELLCVFVNRGALEACNDDWHWDFDRFFYGLAS